MVQCIVCDRVSISFNAPIPQLHPFLIMGLGYWWNLNFAKPFPLIMWYNSCVLVMVEHFSKWIELMLLLDKSNEGVAYAFLDQILNQFGVTNWSAHGSRQKVFGKFWNIVWISLDKIIHPIEWSPKVDLVEMVLQIIKRDLQKYGL